MGAPDDAGPGPGGRSVFVVEDAPDLRMLYRLSLERSGYVLAGEAATGREAVEAAAAADPDIVLVDLMLPDASGVDVIAGLRVAVPRATIIVCSGIDDPETEVACRAAGAHAFLSKAAASNVAASLSEVLGLG